MAVRWLQGPGRIVGVVVASAAAGALVAHFLDRDRGHARRARLRDESAGAFRHLTRRVTRAGRRRTRTAEGRFHGLQARFRRGPRVVPDDVTLAQKVRSEVLGEARFRSFDVHVDAYEGSVHLRGELPTRELIDDLVAAVERVHGVRTIDNYLHLPGSAAPNKEDALRASSHRATMAR